MNNKRTNLTFHILFLISTCLIAIAFKQYFVLIIAVIPGFFIIKQKYRWEYYLGIAIALFICILLILFIPQEWELVNIANFINNNIDNNLRSISIQYLSENYQSKELAFLNVLLFNEKNYQDETIQIFKNLGMLHLFVVSGLHISILTSVFTKIFNKQPWIAKSINLLIALLIWYFSNFSLSIFRVILLIFLSFFNKFRNFNSFEKNCIVGLFVCIFFVHDASSYSFILIKL